MIGYLDGVCSLLGVEGVRRGIGMVSFFLDFAFFLLDLLFFSFFGFDRFVRDYDVPFFARNFLRNVGRVLQERF